MKTEQLAEWVSGIDDETVEAVLEERAKLQEAAEKKEKTRKNIVKWTALAASVVLLAAGAAVFALSVKQEKRTEALGLRDADIREEKVNECDLDEAKEAEFSFSISIGTEKMQVFYGNSLSLPPVLAEGEAYSIVGEIVPNEALQTESGETGTSSWARSEDEQAAPETVSFIRLSDEEIAVLYEGKYYYAKKK